MPTNYIKNLAKDTGKSEKELEKLWIDAKEITSDFFGKSESEFTDKEWSYTVGIVKNMLGLKENNTLSQRFIASKLSIKDFLLIETMTSRSVSNVLDNPKVIKKKKVEPEDDEDTKKEGVLYDDDN